MKIFVQYDSDYQRKQATLQNEIKKTAQAHTNGDYACHDFSEILAHTYLQIWPSY